MKKKMKKKEEIDAIAIGFVKLKDDRHHILGTLYIDIMDMQRNFLALQAPEIF